jgi:hypothetical protein
MYESIIAKVKYKEGWKVVPDFGAEFFPKGHRTYYRWKWEAEDATNLKWTGKMPIFGTMFKLPPGLTERQVLHILLEAAMECELHEAMEYFKYEDKPPFDPHSLGVGLQDQYAQALKSVLAPRVVLPPAPLKFQDSDMFKHLDEAMRRSKAR